MLGGQRRRMSSYSSNYSRRLEQAEGGSRLDSDDKQVALLRQLNKVDPESVIRWFESRPLPHLSSAAMAEYVKALVKVDRLDESALLKTLQRGNHWHCLKILNVSYLVIYFIRVYAWICQFDYEVESRHFSSSKTFGL